MRIIHRWLQAFVIMSAALPAAEPVRLTTDGRLTYVSNRDGGFEIDSVTLSDQVKQ